MHSQPDRHDPPCRVLIIEDNEDDFVAVRALFAEISVREYELEWVKTFDAGIKAICRGGYDVCLVNLQLGGWDGIDLIRGARIRSGEMPMIVLTGHDSPEADNRALAEGAADFLVKSQITAPLLERSIRYAVERKRAKEALVESEERYRSLVELSPDAIFISCEGKVVFANLSAMRLFGAMSAAELIGKPAVEFAHPDHRDLAERRIRQIMEGGERVPLIEVKFLRLDGAEVDVEVTENRFQWQGRQAVQAIVRDITKRKRAEEALKESEARFKRLFEKAPLGYQSLNIDGEFIEVNQAWLDMFGYSREDVIGRSFENFFVEKDEFRKTFPQFKEVGEAVIPNGEFVCKDGSTKIIHIDGRIGYDEKGNFLQTHCMLTDITERKRAREALKESEERLKMAVEVLGAGIWDWNIQSGQILLSPCLKLMIGFGGDFPDSISAWQSRIHPDDLADMRKKADDIVEGRSSMHDAEYRILHNDGHYIWIHSHGLLHRDENGRPIRMIGLDFEITERKQLEEQIRRD